MRKIKQAIILAGGKSRRFWPLTNKQLLPFLGKPIIDYQIEKLSPFVEQIFIVGNPVTRNACLNRWPAVHFVVQNPDCDGMAGALLSLHDRVEGEALIVNANDVFQTDLLRRYRQMLYQDKYDLIMAGKNVNTYLPVGYWRMQNRQPIGIIEKPSPDQLPSQTIKLVVDYYADFGRLIKQIKKTTSLTDNLYEKTIDRLLNSSKRVGLVTYKGNWYTLKYAWQILALLEYLLRTMIIRSSSLRRVKIAKSAVISGPVVFGDNVKIGDFTKIVGPCYVGDDVTVGDYTLIRESQIGNGCLIGSHTEIARSYLGDGVMLHRNYVGDSVIGNQVLFGAGAITANLRFDQQTIKSGNGKQKIDTQMKKLGTMIGDGSKIGVNVTILPGKKIGSGVQVAPGMVINKDVGDQLHIRPKSI